MKVKYTAAVMDTVYGEIEVMDHLTEDEILDEVLADIYYISTSELDWDVHELDIIRSPHLIVED
jgi:hypothetical protein